MKKLLSLLTLLALLLPPPAASAQPPNRPRPTATVETAIRQHAALPNIQPYTGQPIGDHANPSPGNKTDGVGYYMTGTRPNSFFYYVSRTGKVYADWGPIRDKYAQAGYEFGALGWPSDDEYRLPDGSGYFQRFDADFGDHNKKNVYLSYQNFDNGIMYYLYDKIAQRYTVLTQIRTPNLNPSRPH